MYIYEGSLLTQCGNLFSTCQSDDALVAYDELKVILCDLKIQNNRLSRIHPLGDGENTHLHESITTLESILAGNSAGNFAIVYENEVSRLVNTSCISTNSFTGKLTHDAPLDAVNSVGVATVTIGSDSVAELRSRELERLNEWDSIIQKLNDNRLSRTKVVRSNALLITPKFLSNYDSHDITVEALKCLEDSDHRRSSTALAHSANDFIPEVVDSSSTHISLPLPSIAGLVESEGQNLSPRGTNVIFGPN